MQSEPGSGAPESAAFAQALGTFKREGSNILLVGKHAAAAHGSVCRRLLGDASRDSRYRLFVVTDGSQCSDLHGEGGCIGSAESTRIVTRSEGGQQPTAGVVPHTRSSRARR